MKIMQKDEIKALRDRFDMTQEEFARKVGVSFVTINRLEGGHAKPSRETQRKLNRLAEKLAATADGSK